MQKKSAYRYKSYIAIGSNIGNWKSNFNLALKLMNKFGHVEKISRVYFTKPFGITNQKYFHNAVSGQITLEKADSGFTVKTRVFW